MVAQSTPQLQHSPTNAGGEFSSVQSLLKWLRRICDIPVSLQGDNLYLQVPKEIARELQLRERLVRIQLHGSVELFHEPYDGDATLLATIPVSEL